MNKHELMVQRTNEKLFNTLIKLLKKKRINDISITEICNSASINRSTFYAHFDTVGDLFDATKVYIVGLVRSYINNLSNQDGVGADSAILSKELFKKYYIKYYLQAMKNYRDIFIVDEFSYLGALLKINHDYLFEKVFIPFIFNEGDMDYETTDYFSTFFVRGIDSIVEKWLKGGCKESVEEMRDIIEKCVYYRFD